jgi:hypothetical protein
MRRFTIVVLVSVLAGCSSKDEDPDPGAPPPPLAVYSGPENPAGATVNPPDIQAVLQICVAAGPDQGVDIQSITFSDIGGGDPAKLRYAILMRDDGTTAGAYDAGDTVIDPGRAFSGNSVTFTPWGTYTVAAGVTEKWILAYRWWGVSNGSFRATLDPSGQVSAQGNFSLSPITASGWAFQGNLFTVAYGIPATWASIPASGGPSGLKDHAGVYYPANETMAFFGGATAGPGTGVATTYILSTGTQGSESWTTPGGSSPPARHGHVAVYHASSHTMIVFGGVDNDTSTYPNGVALNDTWSMELGGAGAGTWTQDTTSGTPPPGLWHATAAFDSTGNRLIVFGGRDSAGTQYNTTWVLDFGYIPNPTWYTQATTSAPSPRWDAAAVVDPVSNTMLLFGGAFDQTTPATTLYYSDSFLLDLSTWQWTQLSPSQSPSVRHGMAFGHDPVNRLFVIFGGFGTPNPGPSAVGDVFYFDFASQDWNPVTASGTAHGPGAGAAGAFDPENNRLIVNGSGSPGTSELR